MSVMNILGYGMTYLNRFSKTKSSEARLHTTYSVTLSFMVPKWDKNRVMTPPRATCKKLI